MSALLASLLIASPPSDLGRIATLCPLGDHVNVAVYDFIERAVAEHAAKPVTRDEVRARVTADASRPKDEKPDRAGIVETQLSHVITQLCVAEPRCVSAAVYDASGLAVALSAKRGAIDALGITDDAQWAAMSAAAAEHDGKVAPLTCNEAKVLGQRCGKRLWSVAFPFFEGGKLRGVARCVVDPSRAGGP